MAGEVRLHLAVNVEVECQPSEVEGKRVLGSVVNCWMSRAERVLDLLDRGQNFWRVEVSSAISQSHELHVEYFDGLETLRNRVENQSQSAQWQVNHQINPKWILQHNKQSNNDNS